MVFHLPRFTKCCCCIPLRIGSILIGYLSIIISCVTLASISWLIYRVASFVEKNKDNPSTEHTQEELEQHALSLYLSFAYSILVFIYYLIISIILLYGAHLRNPKYLRIYFKAALYLLVLAAAMVVVSCVFLGFIAAIPLLIWSFFLFICTMVVRSTALVMEEENKPKTYEMQSLYNTERAPSAYS